MTRTGTLLSWLIGLICFLSPLRMVRFGSSNNRGGCDLPPEDVLVTFPTSGVYDLQSNEL